MKPVHPSFRMDPYVACSLLCFGCGPIIVGLLYAVLTVEGVTANLSGLAVLLSTVILSLAACAVVRAIRGSKLHYCARSHQIDAARVLLNHGVNINARTIFGETPLHIAVYHRDADMVSLLRDSGASLQIEDNRGRSALKIAQTLCYDDIADLLNSRQVG